MRHEVCRRDFLKTTIATGGAVSFAAIVPASALGKDGAVAPSERVNIAAIACGGRSRVTKVYEQCEKSDLPSQRHQHPHRPGHQVGSEE